LSTESFEDGEKIFAGRRSGVRKFAKHPKISKHEPCADIGPILKDRPGYLVELPPEGRMVSAKKIWI
jgi:hypothetical protein